MGSSEPTAESAITSYWKQVDDLTSQLYKGKITRTLDRARTMQLTTQIFDHKPGSTGRAEHKPGDKLTLWRQREQAISVEVQGLLGEGACGTVYRVSFGTKTCALKAYRASNGLRQLCDEAAILLRLNYPNNHTNVLSMDFISVKDKKILSC